MIFRSPTGDNLNAAMQQLIDDLNRYHPTIDRLPVFADDAAAAEANLKVGYGYVTPDGIVRRRMG